VINLRFANGAIGNIDLSRNAVYNYDIHTRVLGSEGSLLMASCSRPPSASPPRVRWTKTARFWSAKSKIRTVKLFCRLLGSLGFPVEGSQI
jgi:predicted dehydrogenase